MRAQYVKGDHAAWRKGIGGGGERMRWGGGRHMRWGVRAALAHCLWRRLQCKRAMWRVPGNVKGCYARPALGRVGRAGLWRWAARQGRASCSRIVVWGARLAAAKCVRQRHQARTAARRPWHFGVALGGAGMCAPGPPVAGPPVAGQDGHDCYVGLGVFGMFTGCSPCRLRPVCEVSGVFARGRRVCVWGCSMGGRGRAVTGSVKVLHFALSQKTCRSSVVGLDWSATCRTARVTKKVERAMMLIN